MGGRVSRETGIGVAVTVLAIVAMAFDHLLRGSDDPAAFALSSAISLALSVYVFGFVVRRVKAQPAPAERAATRGFVLSVLSVFAITLVWLGVPWVLAGGGVALGLLGRTGERRRLAFGAVVLGALVLLLSAAFSDWSSET
jgi:hypothetical protein